jgi:hypothetical protein
MKITACRNAGKPLARTLRASTPPAEAPITMISWRLGWKRVWGCHRRHWSFCALVRAMDSNCAICAHVSGKVVPT